MFIDISRQEFKSTMTRDVIHNHGQWLFVIMTFTHKKGRKWG